MFLKYYHTFGCFYISILSCYKDYFGKNWENFPFRQWPNDKILFSLKDYSLDVHSCCLNHYSGVCFPYNDVTRCLVRCVVVRNQITGHDCFTKPYSPVSHSAIIFIQFNTFVSFDMPKTKFTSAKLSMENP